MGRLIQPHTYLSIECYRLVSPALSGVIKRAKPLVVLPMVMSIRLMRGFLNLEQAAETFFRLAMDSSLACGELGTISRVNLGFICSTSACLNVSSSYRCLTIALRFDVFEHRVLGCSQ